MYKAWSTKIYTPFYMSAQLPFIQKKLASKKFGYLACDR